jgi:hypothetical protein
LETSMTILYLILGLIIFGLLFALASALEKA